MPKSYKQFRYSDWEWIAVHFPVAEREDMAITASLIAQCSADEIAKHKQLDPRIVIPLCAIEFEDEINWEKLRESKKEIQQVSSDNPSLDMRKFDEIVDYISNSERWKTLFLSLEDNLQRDLLYRLSDSYRRLTRNDWRFYFKHSEKYEFMKSWHYRLVLSYIFLFVVFCIFAMNTIVLAKHHFWIYSLTGLALYILIGFWICSLHNPKYFIKFGLFGLLTFPNEFYQFLSNNLGNSNIDIFVKNIATEAVIGTIAGTLILGMGVTDASDGLLVAAMVLSVATFVIGIGALMGKVSWGMALIAVVTGILILAGAGIVTGTGIAIGASTVALAVNVAVFLVVVGLGVSFGAGVGVTKMRWGMALFLAGAVAITEAGVVIGTVAGAITVAIFGSLAIFVVGVGAFFGRVSWTWVMAIAMIGTLILARVVAGVSTVHMLGVRFGIFTGILLSLGKLSWYGWKGNQKYFRFLAIFTFPLFCWFPILVSFTTIFFLGFLSWQNTLLIWLISLGICTSLWLYGQDKERKAKNPLKGIL